MFQGSTSSSGSDFVFPEMADFQLDWDTTLRQVMGDANGVVDDNAAHSAQADPQLTSMEGIGGNSSFEELFDVQHAEQQNPFAHGTVDQKPGIPSYGQQPLGQHMPHTPPPLCQSYSKGDRTQARPRLHSTVQGVAPAVAQAPGIGLAFSNIQQAKAAMSTRHLEKDWRAPKKDNTLPRNDQDRATYVIDLLDAMQDSSMCSDKRDAPAFRNRWTPEGSHKPNPRNMEIVCWRLVDIAERLHADGPASLSIYDSEALHIVWKSRGLTFGARMQKLAELLRLSKARCFSLLKGENLETTVGAPGQKVASTNTNFEQNGKREELIAAGRPLVQNRKVVSPPAQQNAGSDAGTAGEVKRDTAPAPGRSTLAPAQAPAPLPYAGQYHGGPSGHEHNTVNGHALDYTHQVGNAKSNQSGDGNNVDANRAPLQFYEAPSWYTPPMDEQPPPVRPIAQQSVGQLRPANIAHPALVPHTSQPTPLPLPTQPPAGLHFSNGRLDIPHYEAAQRKRYAETAELDTGTPHALQRPRRSA